MHRLALDSIRISSACKTLSVALIATFLMACEAELHLEGVEASLAKPIRRTDQFTTVEPLADGRVMLFADHGVIVEGAGGQSGELEWTRSELVDPAPNFIASTHCADGTVHALSFGNSVWTTEGEGWQAHPVPTEEQLQAIACSPRGDLWVVGSFGTIMRSGDGAMSWEELSLYEDFTLTAVQFVDDEVGYTTGEFGTVVKTVDGGDSWEMLDPVNDDLYPLSMHFTDRDNGWVSGVLGLIMHTVDGGMTWSREDVDSEAAIYGFVVSNNQLFAHGDLGALLRFDGSAWVDYPSPDVPVHYASAVTLSNGDLLLVGGWGLVVDLPIEGEGDKVASRTGETL